MCAWLEGNFVKTPHSNFRARHPLSITPNFFKKKKTPWYWHREFEKASDIGFFGEAKMADKEHEIPVHGESSFDFPLPKFWFDLRFRVYYGVFELEG